MDWGNPKPAPGLLALVQDFVNTRNYLRGGDWLEDVGAAEGWLADHELLEKGERIGEAGRQRLVAFREGLRSVLDSHNGKSGADTEDLDDIVSSASLRVRFWPDGAVGLEPHSGGGPAERVVARLLVVVVRAEAEGRWQRLKACRNEDCRWAFYDASKNRSGGWCDMSICGARHKMRAYRRRKSGAR